MMRSTKPKEIAHHGRSHILLPINFYKYTDKVKDLPLPTIRQSAFIVASYIACLMYASFMVVLKLIALLAFDTHKLV